MKDLAPPPPPTELRPPAEVMRLGRMGALFPTRLSFLRSLLRRLAREGARLERPVWEIDARGHGQAVYTLGLGGHVYSLVAIATDLPQERRSDRVIATAWDTSYVLYDGIPDDAERARIAANAPLQEAGRFGPRDLVLSRANKSVRLFDHVVARLRAGMQPDPDALNAVGYLMRTTAVYGNGKFGIADRARIAARPGLSGPFAAEMLTVWLIRAFTHDLVEHLGGAPLDRDLKRHLGIGNATGLGMAPFLVSHPVLLGNWMTARETALARICDIDAPSPAEARSLRDLARRVTRHLAQWQVADPHHQARIDRLRSEWPQVVTRLDTHLGGPRPLAALLSFAGGLSPETQELVVALMLEPFGARVDDLCETMADPGLAPPLPETDAAGLRRTLEDTFDWALGIDFDDPEETRRFWYVSAEKLEPRLGDRHAEPGAEREAPLDIARRMQALYRALEGVEDLTAFRAAAPEHELAIARVALVRAHPYCEIRDNLIGADCRPIDMLRCKLSFFGATKFDPKSDLWTRITLAQGAPLPDELESEGADDWWMAVLPA